MSFSLHHEDGGSMALRSIVISWRHNLEEENLVDH